MMAVPAEYVIYAFVLSVGLIVGSFLNVCIYRLPRRLSIVSPRSRCPGCLSPIKAWQNIPVLSYLLLRGKCHNCGSPISIRYPLVELLNGLLYLGLYYKFGPEWYPALYMLLASVLVVITFIDLEFQLIPNVITLPAILIGIVLSTFLLPDPYGFGDPLGLKGSLIGLFTGGGIFYAIQVLSLLILKKEGMGGGDTKMMAMLGAYIGWKSILITIFVGSLAGSVVGLTLIAIKGRGRDSRIPFGPFLAFGALTAIFFGRKIVGLYLGIPEMLQ